MKNNITNITESLPSQIKNSSLNVSLEGWPAPAEVYRHRL